jgi:hemerythrin-like metal-binding domain
MDNSNRYVFIKWDDASYSVQIKTIDDHHKVLLELINDIYGSFMQKKHLSSTAEILEKLEEYARFHFAFEERIFNQIGYPLKQEHIKEHRAFTDQIKQFKDQMASGVDATFSISNYLRDWLKVHIQLEDRKYAPLFKKAGII